MPGPPLSVAGLPVLLVSVSLPARPLTTIDMTDAAANDLPAAVMFAPTWATVMVSLMAVPVTVSTPPDSTAVTAAGTSRASKQVISSCARAQAGGAARPCGGTGPSQTLNDA